MPKYFNKQTKFPSFTRKLNRWNFTRVTRGPEAGAYYHPLFQRENQQLCMQMTCIGAKDSQQQEPMNPIALGLVTPSMLQNQGIGLVVPPPSGIQSLESLGELPPSFSSSLQQVPSANNMIQQSMIQTQLSDEQPRLPATAQTSLIPTTESPIRQAPQTPQQNNMEHMTQEQQLRMLHEEIRAFQEQSQPPPRQQPRILAENGGTPSRTTPNQQHYLHQLFTNLQKAASQVEGNPSCDAPPPARNFVANPPRFENSDVYAQLRVFQPHLSGLMAFPNQQQQSQQGSSKDDPDLRKRSNSLWNPDEHNK
jgi:hypothetical protein